MQFGAFGDIALSTAVLRDWRLDNPDVHVTWYVLEPFREAVHLCPLVDDYIAWPIDPCVPRVEQERAAWEQMKSHARQQFDELVVPQHWPDNYHVGRADSHLLDMMYQNAGVTRRGDARIVMCGRGPKRRVGRKPVLAFNGRSVSQDAVWLPVDYERLMLLMPDWTFVCGDMDGPWCRFDGSLSGWHGAISSSDVYLGLNSGGTWIAASTGVPQVSLWRHAGETPLLDSLRDSGLRSAKMFREFYERPTPHRVADAIRELHESNVVSA